SESVCSVWKQPSPAASMRGRSGAGRTVQTVTMRPNGNRALSAHGHREVALRHVSRCLFAVWATQKAAVASRVFGVHSRAWRVRHDGTRQFARGTITSPDD